MQYAYFNTCIIYQGTQSGFEATKSGQSLDVSKHLTALHCPRYPSIKKSYMLPSFVGHPDFPGYQTGKPYYMLQDCSNISFSISTACQV